MKSAFRIFFRAEDTRPAFVLCCLLLAGLSEAAGITTMLPAVTEMSGGAQEGSSPLNGRVMGTLESIGIAPALGNMIIIIVALLCLKELLSFVALTYVGYSVAAVATGMRAMLVEKLFKVRWSYFNEQRVGRIANAMSVDATRAGFAYSAAARAVSYLIQVVFYMVVALQISPRLALVGLTLGGAMTAAMSVLSRVARRAAYRQTDRTRDLVVHLSDALSNIKALKTMERTAAFARVFSKKVRAVRRSQRTQVLARQGLIYGQELIIFVCLGAGLYTAAVVWQIPLPELVVMGLLFLNVVRSIGKIQQFSQKVMQFESAYFRLKELTDHAMENAEANPGTRAPEFKRCCRLEKVSFSHDDKPVIHGADLEIPVRGITVLQGPSGAGKTTLVDLVTGLYRPDEGRVLVDDTPLEQIDLDRWRSMIGYVPQELTLFHDSLFVNVTLGDESLSEDDVREALQLAGIWDTVAQLPERMMTVVGEHGARFSGGERQRIALARALVARPRLLILDEVTSALDPQTERAICDNILALADRFAIVAITHRPIWASIASNLYTVEDGRVTRVTLTDPVTEAV